MTVHKKVEYILFGGYTDLKADGGYEDRHGDYLYDPEHRVLHTSGRSIGFDQLIELAKSVKKLDGILDREAVKTMVHDA